MRVRMLFALPFLLLFSTEVSAKKGIPLLLIAIGLIIWQLK